MIVDLDFDEVDEVRLQKAQYFRTSYDHTVGFGLVGIIIPTNQKPTIIVTCTEIYRPGGIM